MGIIYKIYNDINDKVYIGQTSVGLQVRWEQHVKNSNDINNNAVLYRAIRKYGISVFHIEQIEECQNNLLNEREIYWIKYYNSYKNGYNSTKGGTALPSGRMFQRLDTQKIRQLWDQGLSINEISLQTGYSKTGIRDHLKDHPNYSQQKSSERGHKKAGETKRKKISQWNLNGELIKTYSGSSIAAKETNIPIQNIDKCLHNKRQTAGNFYWTYENQLPNIKKITKIYQYDLEGNLINIYNTKAEASKALHCDSGSITKVCRGERKTCAGYIWKEK